MNDVTLRRKAHVGELDSAGDYCIVVKDGERKAVLACPVCAAVFYCPHTVSSEEPLTLMPSVVGPKRTNPLEEWNSQVLGLQCLHHFWVKDGLAVGIS